MTINLLRKLPIGIALGISVVGLIFSPIANAQLIREEFEGNFNLIDVSPQLKDTLSENIEYSGFVIYSENGTLKDWEINI